MQGYFYILANKNNVVVYCGSTADLIRRVYQHKNNFVKGFTEKYNVHKLIYYETYDDINEAIHREYQIKRWSRKKKNRLIRQMNLLFRDLYEDIT